MSKLQDILSSHLHDTGNKTLTNDDYELAIEFCDRKLKQYAHNKILDNEKIYIDWIMNVENRDDQRTLIALSLRLFFIRKEEQRALIRATKDIVLRALVKKLKLTVSDPKLDEQLKALSAKVWCIGLTDSMPMPDFWQICPQFPKLSRNPNLQSTMETPEQRAGFAQIYETNKREVGGFSMIVIMDDFVGTGSQAYPLIDQLCRFLKHRGEVVPVLFLPLIAASESSLNLDPLRLKFPFLDFEPCQLLRNSVYLNKKQHSKDEPIFNKIRVLAETTESIIGFGSAGFGELGLLFGQFSNTPDNSLPMIHKHVKNWSGLLPRRDRKE